MEEADNPRGRQGGRGIKTPTSLSCRGLLQGPSPPNPRGNQSRAVGQYSPERTAIEQGGQAEEQIERRK